MSLINDALKRASQAQRPPSPPSTAGPLGIPLQPVEQVRRPSGSNWLVPVLGIALVVMSALFVLVWVRSQRNTQVANAPQAGAVANPPSPTPAPVSPPAKAATPTPPPQSLTTVAKAAVIPPPKETPKAPVQPAVTEVPKPVAVEPSPPPPPVVVPVAPTPPPPVVAPVVKAEFPTLKLQGVFYRLSRPSALISGKTVFIGDKVEGAKVVSIERMSVTLEFSGERKVLNLE